MPLLGAARTAQLSSFWSTGLKSLSFSNSSTFGRLIERPTGYTWATRDSNSGSQNNAFISPSATVDISGLTGYSTYNYLRSTRVATFYPDSTTWSGWASPNSTMSTVRVSFTNTDPVDTNSDLNIGLVGSTFQIQAGFGNQSNVLSLPGSASAYYDKFMTVVVSTSETSGSFTSWTGGSQGSNTFAMRIAAYDTKTGVLISKSDIWLSAGNTGNLNWATKFGSTLTVDQSFTANTCFVNLYGTGADTDTGNPLTRYGCYWLCFGTMFDPLNQSDTSWLTNAPGKKIGDAQVMIQSQYTEYDNAGSNQYYNKSPAGVSLYSQSANRDWISSPINNATAATMYSSTIKIGNS